MATPIETGIEPSASAGRGAGTALGQHARPRRDATAPYQQLADEDRGTGGESLSDFLGYFSIGLGLAEVLAPTAIARLVGIKHPNNRNRTLLRLMGLREISSGVAILSNQQPKKAVMSRVAGDALDLALLGATLASSENDRGRTLFATANVLAVTALDVMASKSLAKQPDTSAHEQMEKGIIRTKRSITVQRPVDEVYSFWHDFQNLPQFMRHLESVRMTGDRRSHWVAKAPAGKTVEWDAETTEDRTNEVIAWRSLPGSKVYNAGEVRFSAAPGDRGTELRVTLDYDPPFGKLGSKLAMLWREEPGQQIADDLRHFKQVMETGEIVLSDSTKRRGPRPAQPDDKPVQL
jgi:uncharacterized membrane protein